MHRNFFDVSIDSSLLGLNRQSARNSFWRFAFNSHVRSFFMFILTYFPLGDEYNRFGIKLPSFDFFENAGKGTCFFAEIQELSPEQVQRERKA